jgi:hypothetical protein
MWVVVGVVVAVVAIATYVTWLANRVDRLHARAQAALLALDGRSVRRAVAATDLSERLNLPEIRQRAAAVLALDAEDDPALVEPGLRSEAENHLTRVLRAAAGHSDPDALGEVIEASRRLALARQVHSDQVRDALAVRRRPLVRLLRLARRHPTPAFFDIDDPTLEPPRAA